MINKEMTVAEAIKEKPEVVSLLAKLNIDYCCGGNKKFAEAIKGQNIDLDKLIDDLNKYETKESYSIDDALNLNKEDLINYIIDKHHITELNMLKEIDKNLQRLINAHYKSHGEELSELYQQFLAVKGSLVPHFYEEENKEFPDFIANKKVDFTKLKEDHEHVGSMLKEIELKTNNFTVPSDGCATYKYTFELMKNFQDDIHQHIFLENSVLFLM